jgi:glucose-1-phosphate thymidylyltransferase
MIKGVLLCGGEGTRLLPLTLSVNKHLLRVGNLPMVEYPLRKMIQAGINNIHVIVGGENYPAVVKYLGSGVKWNVRITYSIQDRSGGIAEALGMAEPFIGKDKMLVILGDNIFDDSLVEPVQDFIKTEGLMKSFLFPYLSDHPEKFGCIVIKDGKYIDVIEKPIEPPSRLILTGIYLYTSYVFDIIKTLKPSVRNELEITDVNRLYIQSGLAEFYHLTGRWTDCGTFESLKVAEAQVKEDSDGKAS